MAETITVSYSAGSFSASGQFPNGSGTRIIAAAKTRLALDPTSTNAQVFAALVAEFFKNVQQLTLNTEREAARVAADAGVATMPLT